VRGFVLAAGADSGHPLTFPVGAVQRLQLSLGRHSAAGKGAALGFLIGAMTGAVAGLAQGDDPPDSFVRLTAGQKGLVLGVVGGGAGALLGVIIGASSQTERWEEIPMHSSRSVLRRLATGSRSEPPWRSDFR
jgi:hypothetical protein